MRTQVLAKDDDLRSVFSGSILLLAKPTVLTNLLDSASPWNRKNETTVRELLHEAAGRITNELKETPKSEPTPRCSDLYVRMVVRCHATPEHTA